MGVVNVTPDSFSDGGQFLAPDAACAHALALIAAGADVIDVGGESTRPGSDPVTADDEMARVLPVIEALASQSDVPIAIDTMKPDVARAAIHAGASIWNDVTALRHAPDSIATAAELGVPVILMHMLGAPKTMQSDPRYDDVVGEVGGFLLARAMAARDAGVDPTKIWVDPGVGFGKTLDHNLDLIRNLRHLVETVRFPLVFGASRKRFIHAVDASAGDENDRLGGSLAAALWATQAGARMIRVHDVRETAQAVALWSAIAQRERVSPLIDAANS